VLLQQQYREKGFKKYSELISCFLVAEQNNELLMKNHESCPTGIAPFPKVNVATHDHYNHRQTHGRGRGCNHGRGNNHGHGRGHGCGRGDNKRLYKFSHQKWRNNEKINKDKSAQNGENNKGICYCCSSKGH